MDQPPPLGKFKVMMVDDEADIRRIGQLSMENIGNWQVVLVASGADAVKMARQERPQVILLDVMMPGTDGLTTLGHLRDEPDLCNIPVIFMTAKVQRHEIERYLALGGTGVISKPFDPLRLPEAIRALLKMPAISQ